MADRKRQAYLQGLAAAGVNVGEQSVSPQPQFMPVPQRQTQAVPQAPTVPTPEQLQQLQARVSEQAGGGESTASQLLGFLADKAPAGVGKVWDAAMFMADVGNKWGTRPGMGWLEYMRAKYDPAELVGLEGMDDDERARLMEAYERGGYSEVWEESLADDPGWLKFVLEAGLDPTNLLIGAGAGAKALKGTKIVANSGALTNAVRFGEGAAKGIDWSQGAIISEPFRAVRGLGRMTGANEAVGRTVVDPTVQKIKGAASSWLERTPETKLKLKQQDLSNVTNDLLAQGFEPTQVARPTGTLNQMQTEQALNFLTNATNKESAVKAMDTPLLARLWEPLSQVDPADPSRQLVERKLKASGLIREVKIGGGKREYQASKKLTAHADMDRVADDLQLSPDARTAFHDSLDMGAYVIYNENKDTYKNIDEVYGLLKPAFSTDQTPKSSGELYQTWTELFADTKGTGRSMDIIDPATGEMRQDVRESVIDFWSADVPELIRRGEEVQKVMGDDRSSQWYMNVGKGIAMMGFRDDVPALSDDIIEKILTNTEPGYRVRAREMVTNKKGDVSLKPQASAQKFEKGEVVPPRVVNKGEVILPDVNPVIDSAHRMGETLINRLDPRIARAAGIDMNKYADGIYSGPTPEFIDEATPFAQAQRLDEADTYAYVRERMRGMSQRRLATTLWGAGGIGMSPQGNTSVIMEWWRQIAVEGNLPSGLAPYPESYAQGRRAAGGMGDFANLNQDSIDALWLNPDYRYAGRGPEPSVKESDKFSTQMVADMRLSDDMNPQSAVAIVERDFPTSQRVEVHGMADKIHSYADAVYEYSNMWEAYDRLMQIDPQAAVEFLDAGTRNIPGVVLDRHMWRLYGENQRQYIGKKGTVSKETKAGGLDMPGDSEEEWAAGKVLSEILFQETRNHPVLSTTWRNANDVQAALWYVSFLNQNKSETGFGFAAAMRDVFAKYAVGDDIPETAVDEVYARTAEMWNDPAQIARAVDATKKPQGNSILDFLADKTPKAAYQEILKSGKVRPDDRHLDEVAQWFKMKPDAMRLLFEEHPELSQELDGVVRGGFKMLDNGAAQVTFRPQAGVSTALHELVAHGLTNLSGAPAMGRLAGVTPGGTLATREGQEAFAQSAEGFLRSGQIPSDPKIAEMMGRMKRLSDLEFSRQANPAMPSPEYNRLMDTALNSQPVRVGKQALKKLKAGTASAADVKQIVKSGDYVTLSAARPNMTPDELIAKTDALEADLRAMGYTPYRAEGIYGGDPEPSFFVPMMTREDAITLGTKYDQESVLRGDEGLIYTTGDRVGEVDQIVRGDLEFNRNATDYHTNVQLADGTYPLNQKFAQGIQAFTGNPSQTAYENAARGVQFGPPRADAGLTEVLDQIAAESGLEIVPSANKVRDLLEPVFSENPEHFSFTALWNSSTMRPMVERIMRSNDATEQQRLAGQIAERLDGTFSGLGVAHPGWAAVFKRLSPPDQKKFKQGTRAFGAQGTGSRATKRQVNVMSEAMEHELVQEYQSNYERALSQVGQVLSTMNQRLPTVKKLDDPLLTVADLNDAVKATSVPAEKQAIQQFIKSFNLPKDMDEAMTMTHGQAWQKGFLQAHEKAVRKELGITITDATIVQQIGEAAAWIPKAWREQALLSVRYHAANALDMVAKSVVYGVNPLVPRNSAQMWFANIGKPVPAGLLITRDHSVPGNISGGVGSSALRRIPVLGRPWGRASEASQSFAHAMEDSFRGAAAKKRSQDFLRQEVMDRFEGDVSRLVPTGADEVVNAFRATPEGLSFSPQQVYDTVLAHGGNVQAAQELSNTWNVALDEAIQEGVSFSNKVHFNVIDERNIEKSLKLRHILPFHFWMTRNMPFYLETLAAHPELLRIWETYSDVSEEEMNGIGIPNRFKGKNLMRATPLDGLFETVFGPGKAYFNPLVTLSITDQFRDRGGYVDENATWIGQRLQQLEGLGIAPAPWVSIPLSAIGVYGPTDEQSNVLRYSGLVDAATGFDLGEQKFRDAQAYVREGITNKKVETISGSAYKDYQIGKKLSEMAVEMGSPNDPMFLNAMKDPEHPLYKVAEAQIREENKFAQVNNLLNPVPLKFLPQTEEYITAQKATIPQEMLDDKEMRNALVDAGHPGVAYFRTPKPRVLEPNWQDQNGFPASGAPSTGFPAQRSETKWGGDVWGPQAAPPFNSPAIYQVYLVWREEGGINGDTSPETFVAAFGR
jgi:hypothetical protein